jgi:hypothetical protein
VVGDRISKRVLEGNTDAALSTFHEFLAENIELEPTLDEQYAASVLELSAQRAGVELDAGESQLCSILVSRALPLFLTGDKRAICAIETLLDHCELLAPAAGKVMSLEQLIFALLEIAHIDTIRQAVCGRPTADRSLSICFCCASGAPTSKGDVQAGISSYIRDLRQKAPRVLAA